MVVAARICPEGHADTRWLSDEYCVCYDEHGSLHHVWRRELHGLAILHSTSDVLNLVKSVISLERYYTEARQSLESTQAEAATTRLEARAATQRVQEAHREMELAGKRLEGMVPATSIAQLKAERDTADKRAAAATDEARSLRRLLAEAREETNRLRTYALEQERVLGQVRRLTGGSA